MSKIEIGSKASQSKRFTKHDVKSYADLTGDYNPIHFDEEFAKGTLFKRPIVHGPLVITLITTMFANVLPGPGSVYLSHEVKYRHPVYINDEITGIIEVIDINIKNHIIIQTSCINQDGTLILEGVARLKLY